MAITFIADYRGCLTNEAFFATGTVIEPADHGLTAGQTQQLIRDGRAERFQAPEDEDAAPKPKGKGKK